MTDATFAHVGFTCQDPLTVERFYTRHFGFRRVRVVPLGDEQIVFTQAGALMLEIFRATEERPIPAPEKDGYPWPGLRHLAFQVESVDAKLQAMGDEARVMLGPMDFDDFIPGWRAAWIADPEGNIIEISQGYQDQAPAPPPLEV